MGYTQGSKGIHVHADDALVNLNFWIVPDEANMDPSTGGMVVYGKEPPQGFDSIMYNHKGGLEGSYLEGVPAVHIPYRQNRMVMFKSTQLHATEPHSFRQGYANRRINFTLLFGRRPS